MMKGAMEEQDDGLKTISYSKNISKTPNIIPQPKRRLKKKRKVNAKKKYTRDASAKTTTKTNGIYAYDKYR